MIYKDFHDKHPILYWFLFVIACIAFLGAFIPGFLIISLFVLFCIAVPFLILGKIIGKKKVQI